MPLPSPPDKYSVLIDGADWTTNVGYPGYTNAAVAEVMASGLIPTMFAQAATGQLTPEDALAQADQDLRHLRQVARKRQDLTSRIYAG